MRKTVVNAQIEELYGEYLENPAQNELEAALAELGGKLDECPAITASDLAQYEEAARHAAFYAGYHKAKGDSVEWWWGIEHYDRVYMSKVFDDTYSPDIPAPFNADRIVRGGTGYCMGYEQKFTELVPTPRASDGKRAALNRCWMPDSQTVQVERERERERRYRGQLHELLELTPRGRIGLVNPEWVEWLMGFPIGWTDLGASEMQ